MTAFLQDYENAVERAIEFDTALTKNASSLISSQYADLVALTARQTMAGVDLTIGGSDGAWNLTDVRMYMKDIGQSK